MRCLLLLTILAAMTGCAVAALPPVHQNPKDLAVMVSFVQRHPVMMQSLRIIDLEKKIVLFGGNCEARFGRVSAPLMPGPAPALEYKSSNCPVGPEQGT